MKRLIIGLATDQVSLQPDIVILPTLSGTGLCNSGGTINEESIHLRVVPEANWGYQHTLMFGCSFRFLAW